MIETIEHLKRESMDVDAAILLMNFTSAWIDRQDLRLDRIGHRSVFDPEEDQSHTMLMFHVDVDFNRSMELDHALIKHVVGIGLQTEYRLTFSITDLE